MANVTTIKLNADISGLKKGIQDANRQIKLANAEFKAAASGMENWSKSSDGINAKLKQLDTVLSNQKAILKSYEKQLELVVAEQGENSKGADELRIKIANQQAVVNKTTAEIGKYKTALSGLADEQDTSAAAAKNENSALEKLKGTITAQKTSLESLKKEYANIILEQGEDSDAAKTLAQDISKLSKDLAANEAQLSATQKAADALDQSLADAGDSATTVGNDGFTVFKGALANLVSDGIELAISKVKELGTQMINLGKTAYGNYASYEQLVGGVDTLFKGDSKELQKYAANAYKTAGMSANQYMETATSFAASLIQGLGGDTSKAVKYVDTAITDMSDNANKMGTNIDSIQNAYQGFAKQNYTMLDNLKLGYGGTQKEMARLMQDAAKLDKDFASRADFSIDSKGHLEASYADIVEAIHIVQKEMGITGTTAAEAAGTIEGSTGSMKAAWDNFLTGIADENSDVDQLWENFAASAESYISNMVPRVKTLVSQAIDFIARKLEENYPEVMDVLTTIGKVIKTIFNFISDNWQIIVAALASIVAGFLAFNTIMFISSIPGMILSIVSALGLLNAVIAANPIGAAVIAIAALVAGFITLWKTSDKFRNFWITLWENIKTVVSGAVNTIIAIITTIWNTIQTVASNIIEIVAGVIDSIKTILSTIAQWINDNVVQPILTFLQPLINFFVTAFEIITQLAVGCWEAIKAVWSLVSEWFNKNVIKPVTKFFSSLWSGIKNKARSAWNGIKTIWSGVTSWFNATIITPVSNFFTGMWDGLKTGASKAWSGIKSTFKPVVTWFKDKFSKAWQAVKDVFSTGGKIFDGIKEGIADAFKTIVNGLIGGINKVIAVPFKAINGMLDKIKGVKIGPAKPFKKLISRFDIPEIPTLMTGGVLARGQLGLLEGNGAEAVVPLERNKKWIAKTAQDLKVALNGEGLLGGSGKVINNNYTFNQTNNSPKPLSRLEIYRQTKNQLNFAKGV